MPVSFRVYTDHGTVSGTCDPQASPQDAPGRAVARDDTRVAHPCESLLHCTS